MWRVSVKNGWKKGISYGSRTVCLATRPTVSVISAKTTRGTANQAGVVPPGGSRPTFSLMRILLWGIARSATCSDHQAVQVDVLVRQLRGVDRHALADQLHRGLEFSIRFRILRIAATVEADHRAHDSIRQVEAQKRSALESAANHDAVPACREPDVLDRVLVLIRPEGMDGVVEVLAAQQGPGGGPPLLVSVVPVLHAHAAEDRMPVIRHVARREDIGQG